MSTETTNAINDATALLSRCQNQFGSITTTSGSNVVVNAVHAFIRTPSKRTWNTARRFYVSWEGERYTLGRAAEVFAGLPSGDVPAVQDVIATLRAVSA